MFNGMWSDATRLHNNTFKTPLDRAVFFCKEYLISGEKFITQDKKICRTPYNYKTASSAVVFVDNWSFDSAALVILSPVEGPSTASLRMFKDNKEQPIGCSLC